MCTIETEAMPFGTWPRLSTVDSFSMALLSRALVNLNQYL